ncbi:DUF4905 domain-containing protein [Mucilaginibacter sp. Bleaf8]|uniref:DUF4905 domain-containing protein n=1 Tax=Mucilaginibacter sp. Bleaf8 TaxID=2834430 RepID=UPI001BD01FC9|nr:DUF4905 domain-containing protein [Mucilaginibacter sp. Bleaf8]MBS7562975.1 DUF4905 domain-containing protein [Mucilaginibacter sp. Bleaf8]
MSSLKLLVAEHFEGQVWRMEIDAVSHTLFAEIRHVENRTVTFAAIGLRDGKTYFKNHTVDERWLTGIETAYDGVLLLHFYESAVSPSHKGLAAIDAKTSNLLWNNFNYTFNHLSANGPIFYDSRLQPTKYYLADIRTGVLKRAYEPALDNDFDNQILVPQIIPLPPNLPALPVESYSNKVHYLEYNSVRIVSLHALWAGQLKQYLFITEGDQIIFEDILNTNIQKLQPEAFVLYQNQLIYLKEKSEIQVLNL